MSLNATSKAARTASFNPKEYWETRLSGNLSLQGVGFSVLGTRYNEWLYRLRKNVVRRQLGVFKTELEQASVLDIGSGTGFYVQLWNEMGVMSISGSDLTDVSIDYLRTQYPSSLFYRLDISEQLPEGLPRGFDVISAFDVLFHIVDDTKFHRALQNISSLLSAGGLFCFSDSFLHHQTERSPHHVSRSLAEVEPELTKVGLNVVMRCPVFVLMNEPIDSCSKAWRFLWRVLMYPVRKSETVGYVLGALFYLIDSVLVRFLNESPTTEMMVCRKSP
jgi:SAM-dependent methyltransferase